jgi:hypothetical protein
MKNKLLAVILLGTLAGGVVLPYYGAWAADGDSASLATGFDYSTGKYGSASSTDILTIPVVGSYKTGLWLFKLTVPFVRVSGVEGVLADGRRVKSTTTTRKTTYSGLGDVEAAATYNIYAEREKYFWIDLTGKVKFGTASTNLGTGQNDYSVQADVYQGFDRFTAMGALGYEVLGSPVGVTMNNVMYGILGGYYQIADQTGGGAEMRVAQKPSAIGAEQRELTVYVSHRIDESLKFRAYVLKGFADGSPDSGFGLLVTSDF